MLANISYSSIYCNNIFFFLFFLFSIPLWMKEFPLMVNINIVIITQYSFNRSITSPPLLPLPLFLIFILPPCVRHGIIIIHKTYIFLKNLSKIIILLYFLDDFSVHNRKQQNIWGRKHISAYLNQIAYFKRYASLEIHV